MKQNKKGVFGLDSLGTVAIILVVAAIVIAMGGTILKDIQDTQTSGDADYNATGKGLTSMTTLAKWLPTIAIVVAAAIIIGVVVTSFRT